MNEKKICFIYCTNDSDLLNESIAYINSLHVPEGFEVETISIQEAKSMTSGYNQGMKSTDAKYKVYLHQDVFIINKNFITDVIEIFTSNPKVGLLGVIGAKSTPESGVWWESSDCYGKVYDSHTGSMKLLHFHEVRGAYESVDALDGLILITQYDVEWQEDIFDGWHFYDLSQCRNFNEMGYEVGVVAQQNPWCIHDCGVVNTNDYETYRSKFLEYNKGMRDGNEQEKPLVSILIPAYNRPQLLEIALQSSLAQTYKNIEIIISDDSTNDEVKKMVEPYLEKDSRIIYSKNERNLGVLNGKRCLELASGDYVNFLMDDDVFHREKIEKMMDYFLGHEDVTLITSYRQRINLEGQVLPPIQATKRLFEKDTIIDGIDLGNHCLINGINFIGEPTTVLFRKSDLSNDFGIYKGNQYVAINDLAVWIDLLSKGKAVYISEALSYFRIHPGQNQQNVDVTKHAFRDWLQLIMDARRDGFLKSESQYKEALSRCLGMYQQLIDQTIRKEDGLKIRDVALQAINRCVEELLTHKDYYYCPYCNKRHVKFNRLPDLFDFPGYVMEMFNKETYSCPTCHSIDRERLYKFYIEKETNLTRGKHSILHVAPERNLRTWLSTCSDLHYVCGDLYPTDADMERIDITNLHYNEESFDAIICSHVLDHIENDGQAMSEIFRVLKTGGWAILQVPICVNLDKTYEDWSVQTPEDRLRVFGQDDHVRIYAKDYVNRLQSVGFDVVPYNIAEKYGIEQANQLGLGASDNLYVVYKR
ncbi:glycosyltransferase [Brevibacillus panacihumi]|uniref:glycosyltransferase n=1 Tax=Brevibacillus panacihumi TaxID=497735 RepID=UPI003D229023